tara:strand:- start:34569 stop:36806 length:2238 start_codon:yes stop_codon:yes gene_type:complete
MIRKLLIFSGVGLLIGILSLALFIGLVNYEVFGHLYSSEEIRSFKNETATEVMSADGQLIGKFFAKNRTNIYFEQLPTHVVNALVATEDERFFEHDGVDSRSLFRVLFKTILLNQPSSGGGSTITQQLLKNMYGRQSFGPLTMLVNKTKEALLAYRLESIYSKEEILALYLNTIPFGENVYGIEAASRLFYNKSVVNLTINEGAVLIGMLKANTYYNPRLYPIHAKNRQEVVLHQMMKNNYLTESEYDLLRIIPIQLDYANLGANGPANYFLVKVERELNEILQDVTAKIGKKWDYKAEGLKVETTLDYRLQTFAIQSFEKHLKKMQQKLSLQYSKGKSAQQLQKLVDGIIKSKQLQSRRNEKVKIEVFTWDSTYYDSISVSDSIKNSLLTLHAGFLAMQPNTGAINAWVGGVDFRRFPYDQVRAKRQLASTFKPILYAAALEKGMSPCDYLDNTPKTYTDFDNWTPANYDHSTGGEYSLTGALIRSKNVPSVDLLFQVGYDEVDYLWRKLGFTAHLKHSPSMALGTVDASVEELATGYAMLANGGDEVTPFTITRIVSPSGEVLYQRKEKRERTRVLEERTSLLMNEILQKAINHGTGAAIRNTYGIKTPLAGKTGTSQNFADAWFASYNPNVVMISRVGASYRSIHFNSGSLGSGGRLALPLTALTLQQIEQDSVELEKYSSPFPSINEGLKGEMNCPDFVEDSTLDKFKDFFKSDNTSVEKREKKQRKKDQRKKKKGWFKRN